MTVTCDRIYIEHNKKLKRNSVSPITKIYQDQQYQDRLLDYELWKEKADQLVKAANLLEPDIKAYWNKVPTTQNKASGARKANISRFPMLQDVYFMLNAYALENYFKAIIVQVLAKGGSSQSALNSGRIPNGINTHNLSELAKRANFVINAEEDVLLKRLEDNAIWRGRYPLPTDSKDLSTLKRTSSGQLFPNIGFYSEVRWIKRTPKSDKIERRRCKSERYPARKVHEGVLSGSSETGNGGEVVVAGGRPPIVTGAIDDRKLGEGR